MFLKLDRRMKLLQLCGISYVLNVLTGNMNRFTGLHYRIWQSSPIPDDKHMPNCKQRKLVKHLKILLTNQVAKLYFNVGSSNRIVNRMSNISAPNHSSVAFNLKPRPFRRLDIDFNALQSCFSLFLITIQQKNLRC
jgi:hypothetical protein